MNIDDFKKYLKSGKDDSQQDKLQKYYEQVRGMQNSNSPLAKGLGGGTQQSSQPFYPPGGLIPAQGIQGMNPLKLAKSPRHIRGTFINSTSPEKIKVEIIERLTAQIANLCTKYNLSDKVEMETEVTMVEINGTTTVTLTATVDWLPNPYVFVAMESFQEPPF